MTATTDQLVAACQQQDRDAQQMLYEQFSGRLYRLAVRMVGNEDADDVTQQIFLQLFRTITQFAGRSGFETWLYRLAVNECLQHLRRRKRKALQPLLEEPASHQRDAGARVEQRELIEAALERLDPDLRAVFVLREVEQLNYREIADALDLSDGTVASRLNRARKQLREILLDMGWVP
ncbi:MAG: RNA polymerase sigma factor [Planctomycetes bacterium]|nr:RNA polymerase sigma factor [Planctomycetota bacterium]